jgi:hypothetical protein
MSKSRLREFQDHASNVGWRIQLIPFDDTSRPMMIQTNWYAVIGMIFFLGGIGFYFRKYEGIYLGISIGGFCFACAGLLFAGKAKRRGWLRVNAVCVDREIQRVSTPGPRAAGGYTWVFRLVCKFELDGKEFTVTPGFWRSFGSAEGLDLFLNKFISGDGACLLHVNPRNPLQTELLTGDITDKLLY